MKALIQRVEHARVTVNDTIAGSIGRGLLIFLGIVKGDTGEDLSYLARKIVHLRVFEDSHNRMNLSIRDVKGSLLAVSQFTLVSDCRKGNRPSFDLAEHPVRAEELYNLFIKECKDSGVRVEQGIFGTSMKVALLNDGPVTLLIDSKKS